MESFEGTEKGERQQTLKAHPGLVTVVIRDPWPRSGVCQWLWAGAGESAWSPKLLVKGQAQQIPSQTGEALRQGVGLL